MGNGVACTGGHQAAANMLREAVGTLELEISPRSRSFVQRLSGKKVQSQPSFVLNASFTSVDGGEPAAVIEGQPIEDPSAGEKTDEAAVAAASATTATVASATPPIVPPPPPLSAVPLKPDEYSVTLLRNKTASIGMRLVQKKHTELPFIADIDPQGPAAKTDIKLGDILLEVNGVDARASHDELKKALGTTDAAELKLRRAPTTKYTTAPYKENEGKMSNEGKLPGSKSDGGVGSWFSTCCSARDAPPK